MDSQIKVPPQHKTTAELVITEDAFQSNFKLTSKVSGKVIVTVTNLNDNNAFVKVMENQIGAIVTQVLQNVLTSDIVVQKNVVTFTTEGKCTFRYAVEQHIKLHESKIILES